MIMHKCIECDDFQMIPMADETPCMQIYTCEECNALQYIYHSRLEPKTYHPDNVEVDEETKSIKIKSDD